MGSQHGGSSLMISCTVHFTFDYGLLLAYMSTSSICKLNTFIEKSFLVLQPFRGRLQDTIFNQKWITLYVFVLLWWPENTNFEKGFLGANFLCVKYKSMNLQNRLRHLHA